MTNTSSAAQGTAETATHHRSMNMPDTNSPFSRLYPPQSQDPLQTIVTGTLASGEMVIVRAPLEDAVAEAKRCFENGEFVHWQEWVQRVPAGMAQHCVCFGMGAQR